MILKQVRNCLLFVAIQNYNIYMYMLYDSIFFSTYKITPFGIPSLSARSYGVFLYELMSSGSVPYASFSHLQVKAKVSSSPFSTQPVQPFSFLLASMTSSAMLCAFSVSL